MSDFIVSARKYRPMQFKDVIGQDHITETLVNAIKNDKIAQAFLFCGPRGVGKTTCARILAKTINCENPSQDMTACGECQSCTSFSDNTSFNIHELDAASNNSVEDIRSLTEQVRYAPQTGKYKIYIIDEVHMLSQAAFNAFLKTLEEPPSYAIFILATTEKHKILATILSRCQIFDFNRIPIPEITKQLKLICEQEGIGYEEDALHLIAHKADGALRDGLSIFDRLASSGTDKLIYKDILQNLNILDYDYYFKATEALMACDRPGILLLFDEIQHNGFEGDLFISGLGQHFRDLLMCKDENTHQLLEISENLVLKYKEQAVMASESFLISGLQIINQCELNYRISRNKRLLVELALMKLCYLPYTLEEKKVTITSQPDKKKASNSITGESAAKPDADKDASPIEPETVESTDSETQPGPAENIREAREIIKPKIKEPEIVEIRTQPSRKSSLIKPIEAPTSPPAEDPNIEKVTDKSPISKESTQEKIDPQELESAWKETISHYESKQSDALATILTAYPPMILEGHSIKIILGNKLQYEIVSNERFGIMKILNKKLSTEKLNLEIAYNRETINSASNKPYTDTEKYNWMKEKNPLVQNLMDKLGLELKH